MRTANEILDQHLKAFGENDLDGIVADYSSGCVVHTWPTVQGR